MSHAELEQLADPHNAPGPSGPVEPIKLGMHQLLPQWRHNPQFRSKAAQCWGFERCAFGGQADVYVFEPERLSSPVKKTRVTVRRSREDLEAREPATSPPPFNLHPYRFLQADEDIVLAFPRDVFQPRQTLHLVNKILREPRGGRIDVAD